MLTGWSLSMEEAFVPYAPEHWVRLAELTEELGWSARTLREYIAEAVPLDDRCRVYRHGGGGPELWLSPEGATIVRRRYPSRRGAVPPPPAAPPLHQQEAPELQEVAIPVPPPALEAASRQALELPEVAAPLPRELPEVAEPADHVQTARVPVERWIELERRAQVAELLEAEVPELRQQVAELRAKIAEAERRADTAETLTRRARAEGDRWRSDAEGIRLAWHGWRRQLETLGRWALLRRRFPAEPPEFTSGPAIARVPD